MGRLARYMMGQFARSAFGLLLAAIFLVWITQSLRLFDVVTAKGQDMLTLVGQAFLTTPQLAKEIIPLCAAVGIVRVLKEMLDSRELHAIHSSRRASAISVAVAGFALGGALLALLVSHFIEPSFRNTYENWTERVAADLVSRTLEPGRFREVAPNFVVEIGGRRTDGILTEFFADDTRDPQVRRTYISRTAAITSDDTGYYIQLYDGALQFKRADGRYSEVQFDRYELALDKLSETASSAERDSELTSVQIVQRAQDREFTEREIRVLHSRTSDGLRVLALCLFVAALAGFPTSVRSGRKLPLEFIAVVITLGDQVVTRTFDIRFLGPSTGPALVLGIGLFILLVRVYRHKFVIARPVTP